MCLLKIYAKFRSDATLRSMMKKILSNRPTKLLANQDFDRSKQTISLYIGLTASTMVPMSS